MTINDTVLRKDVEELVSVKEKLLSALDDFTLDAIDESILVDILVKRLADQEATISELRGENAHEKLMLESQWERVREERERIAHDPLYAACGEYHFVGGSKKAPLTVTVRVQGYKIEAAEVKGDGSRWMMQQVPHKALTRFQKGGV